MAVTGEPLSGVVSGSWLISSSSKVFRPSSANAWMVSGAGVEEVPSARRALTSDAKLFVNSGEILIKTKRQ